MKSGIVVIVCIVFFSAFVSGCKHIPFPETPEILHGCGITDTVEYNTIPRNPDSVYFQNDIYPLLLTKCALSGCHIFNTAKVAHGEKVTFCTYEEIIEWQNDEGEKLVVPYNTHDGKILIQITSTDVDHMMPPPPHAPLTSEQIDKFIIWVQQGALNNKCIE